VFFPNKETRRRHLFQLISDMSVRITDIIKYKIKFFVRNSGGAEICMLIKAIIRVSQEPGHLYIHAEFTKQLPFDTHTHKYKGWHKKTELLASMSQHGAKYFTRRVTTCLRCGGVFSDDFIRSSLWR